METKRPNPHKSRCRQVVTLLASEGLPMTSREIADEIEIEARNVYWLMKSAVKKGLIHRTGTHRAPGLPPAAIYAITELGLQSVAEWEREAPKLPMATKRIEPPRINPYWTENPIPEMTAVWASINPARMRAGQPEKVLR